MRQLQDYAPTLSGLLKDQRLQEGESYRLMHFVVQQPVEEGLLLYNVMTRAVVLLTREEARIMTVNPVSVPGLVAKWFAVPLHHNDHKLAQEVRAVGKMMEKRAKGITGFTIFTTTDCNARCFYCYEKGRSRISMKEETARKVAEFIIKNNPEKKVRLRWFGGEPLFNKIVISLICSKLRNAGIEYQSSMVSNGSLFDDETVAEAIGLWNLKNVQITLDGTEDVYNRSKAFVRPEGSPFYRVLGNIRRLLNASVKVKIRLNIDRHNTDDLPCLADILINEFGGHKLLNVYSHALFETGTDMRVLSSTASQRRELFDARMLLQEKLREGKISLEGNLPDKLKLNRCMADCDTDVVILPDGRLGKCEHYSEDHCFGSIDSPERDETLLAEFKRLREEMEACTDCPLYPDCYRLVLCEEAAHCYPEEREEMLSAIRRNLLNFYHQKNHETSD